MHQKSRKIGVRSYLNVNLEQCGCGKDEVFSSSFSKIQTSETLCFWGFSLPMHPSEMLRNVVELCGYVARMHHVCSKNHSNYVVGFLMKQRGIRKADTSKIFILLISAFFCLYTFLSIFSILHNFVYGIDQDPNIKMLVDTFCKSHCSGMSDNLPDGHFLS